MKKFKVKITTTYEKVIELMSENDYGYSLLDDISSVLRDSFTDSQMVSESYEIIRDKGEKK